MIAFFGLETHLLVSISQPAMPTAAIHHNAEQAAFARANGMRALMRSRLSILAET
jgi:hypothetical protein